MYDEDDLLPLSALQHLVTAVDGGDRGRRVQVLDDAAGHQRDRGDRRQRQQDAQRAAGEIDPEVAEPVGVLPGQPADDGDRHR